MRVELNLTWSTLFRGLIALVSLVILLLSLFQPYFVYGEPTTSLIQDANKAEMLVGTWTNDVKKGRNGFVSIEIQENKTALVTRVRNGEKIEEEAEYKYSKSKDQLTVKILDASGNTVETIVADFVSALQYGMIQSYSLSEYIARPYEHEDMTEMLIAKDPEYNLDSAVKLPIYVAALCAVSLVSALFIKKAAWSIASAVLGGVSGIICCISNVIYSMGDSSTFMVFYSLLTALSVLYTLYNCLKKRNLNCRELKEDGV